MTVNAAAARGAHFIFAPTDPRDFHSPEETSPESHQFGMTLRDFFQREVQPRFHEIDASHGEPIPALMRQLAELGFFAAEIPEEFGGLQLPLADVLPMIEELGRASSLGVAAMVHQGIGMQPMVYAASPEITRRYIDGLMSADVLAAYALTEPGAGSDALNGTSSAVLDTSTNEYVINGSKQFITNARWAKVFQVFAQVPGKGMTAFVVERGTPGLEVMAEEDKMGIKGSSTCALRMVDMRVSADRIMGEVGRGHKIAMNMLNIGRLKLGTTMLGAMKELVGHSVRYAGERRQFGQPISSFGMTRMKLAEMAALCFAGEALAYRLARSIDGLASELYTADGGRDAKLRASDEYASECSIAKFWMTEAANLAADHAVQIFGGYGFVEEYPVAQYYRDLRVARLYEGTNEINRINTINALLRRIYKGREGATLKALVAAGRNDASDRFSPVRRILSNALFVSMHESGREVPRLEQDALSAMAEMAAELYAAESAHMRARQIMDRAPADHRLSGLAGHLGALASIRMARVVADRATALNWALGGALMAAGLQADLAALGELAEMRFLHERAAAELVLSFEGAWPSFA